MKNAKVLKKEVIFDKYKKLVKERLKVSDGNELDWIYLDMPQSLLVVSITSNNKLVLVKVYRYNLKKHVYELPAGVCEIKKSLLKEASKELLEETGYASSKLVDLGKYYALPSETNRWVNIVLALDVKKKQKPQLDNIIEKYFDMSVELFDFNKIVKNIGRTSSIITGIEHGFAILLASRHLKRSSG